MNIGYACQIGNPTYKFASCRLSNATKARLREITAHNLSILDKMIDYNIENEIKFFRISSDIIPFATHPVNTIDWKTEYKAMFDRIGKKIASSGMRVSMHPGQYSVLNAIDGGVVNRTILDIDYHAVFLDMLGTDYTCKIILHIGGVYGDKSAAKQRFIQNHMLLSESAKKRLVIENDERSYHIADVLEIGQQIGTPCVFDNLHHLINPPKAQLSEKEWISQCRRTWQKRDGVQKIHYSQQASDKQRGAHSARIDHRTFMFFLGQLSRDDIDIMLEVKDKNISAVKCQKIIREKYQVKYIEQEWARYKYLVLSQSQSIYDSTRHLLKDKKTNITIQFYDLIEQALSIEPATGQATNGCEHVWGHLKERATRAEKISVFILIELLKADIGKLSALKRKLQKLSIKYNEPYLLNSYFFFNI